ncbi:MAG: hypothetical protein WCG87_07340 [Bacteroidota bacterium]
MYKTLLVIHILIGIAALSSGAFAIFSKKGGKLHTQSGKIYYTSMFGIGISALCMTLMKWNPFLLAIAIFSTYLTYSGKKSIDNWRLKHAYVPGIKDKIPFYIAFITSIVMILWPITIMMSEHKYFVPILSVFGLIMFSLSRRDIQMYNNADNFLPRNKKWLLRHIGSMGGAYIATCTAFLLNNIHIDPPWILWLLPTAIGAPIITLAIIKWIKKLKISTDI